MTYCQFEARYRKLKSTGASGWAGDRHFRSILKDRQTLNKLLAMGILPPSGSRILEVGCGNGALLPWFEEAGYQYLGVDISRTAISWAIELRGKVSDAEFLQGDIRDMRFIENRSVDMVCDFACIHCLVGRDWDRAFSEVWQVLDGGGIFIMSTMCGIPKNLPAGIEFDEERCLLQKDAQPHRTLKPLETIVSELKRQGFTTIWQGISENSWWNHATIVCYRF